MSQSLQVGEKAPLFKSVDQDGKPVKSSDFKGKKLALYFYPRDNTPKCTTQACNLRDNYKELQQNGIEIVGVSTDGQTSHKKFEEKNLLPFRILVDEDRKINEAFGVWQLKKFMGKEFMGTVRTTFLINEKGKIVHIIQKPKSKEHSKEIIEGFKELKK